MTFTLAQLKKRAAVSGAELIVLPENGKELWLCVPANTDKKLIYSAASRFEKVYIFNEQEAK